MTRFNSYMLMKGLKKIGAKNFAAGLILLSALVYIGWLFLHSSPMLSVINRQFAIDKNAPINPLSGVKNPLSPSDGSSENPSENLAAGEDNVGGASLLSPNNNNFTQQFVSALQQKAVANQQGTDVDLSGAKFNFGLIDSIDDSAIKISTDNSKAAKKKYLQALSDISAKDRGSFNKNFADIIDATYHDLDSAPAQEAAMIYKNIFSDFSTVAVPSDWKDFQKQLIIYVKNVSLIYSAMADYQNDPMKGYLAFGKIKDLAVGDHSLDIVNSIKEKIKEIQ